MINPFKDIYSARSLQLYGMILAFTHVVTAYSWTEFSFDQSVVCWPFWSSCETATLALRSVWLPVLIVYALASVLTAFMFYRGRTRAAIWLFLVISLIKLGIHLSDFRLMGNYHYMSHIINFLFLFALEKKNTIRLFIVLFYISAGVIKFNTDWLSGAAMLKTPIITGKWLEIACAYVIILELAIVWLLLSANRKYFLFAFIQIVFFHAFSWHIVGYFYPVIMLSLLTIFLLESEPWQMFKNKLTGVVVIIYISCQLYPLLLEKNSSLNGRGRILSLNMLDARSVCESRLFIRFKNQEIEYQPQFSHAGIRIQCDPILLVQRARSICSEQAQKPDFQDIDLDHQVRYTTNSVQNEHLTFTDICTKPLKIGLLGNVYQ